MGFPKTRFARKVRDSLLCSVCCLIVENPVQMDTEVTSGAHDEEAEGSPSCGHPVCLQCILDWKKQFTFCPEVKCLRPLTAAGYREASDQLKVAASDLRIYCEFREQGCRKNNLRIFELEEHVKVCVFKPGLNHGLNPKPKKKSQSKESSSPNSLLAYKVKTVSEIGSKGSNIQAMFKVPVSRKPIKHQLLQIPKNASIANKENVCPPGVLFYPFPKTHTEQIKDLVHDHTYDRTKKKAKLSSGAPSPTKELQKKSAKRRAETVNKSPETEENCIQTESNAKDQVTVANTAPVLSSIGCAFTLKSEISSATGGSDRELKNLTSLLEVQKMKIPLAINLLSCPSGAQTLRQLLEQRWEQPVGEELQSFDVAIFVNDMSLMVAQNVALEDQVRRLIDQRDIVLAVNQILDSHVTTLGQEPVQTP